MNRSVLDKLFEAFEVIVTAIKGLREQILDTQKLVLIHAEKIKELEAALEYERTLRLEGK